ncbi:MAG TPA: DUF1552 domain-containing protein [Cellvibrionaceae bacterium]|nr:DUF1552 domain-containing protein [Cellvibrionaceae bacterium]HNG59283.1 DUF1552 domain-containing protein [Cellvibrionaceae bacterium]
MKRRSLIQGIVAAPLWTALPLSHLITRTAMAADRPIRTLFIYHPDGCTPELWHPAASSSSPSLKAQSAPLEKVKQYCTFMDGFYLVGKGDTHEGGAVKVLTANDASSSQGSTSSSIEVALGQLSPTLFKSYQIGCFGGYWADKSICFNGSSRLPIEDNPQNAFKTLFSSGSSSSGGGNTNASQLRILDNVSKDLARLRSQLGSIEKERLDMHAESFKSLQDRLTAQGNQSGGTAACVSSGINLQGLGANEARSVEKLKTISEVQQDIIIQALSCDLVRNVVFSYSHPVSPIVVPGSSMGDHDASHASPSQFTPSKTWWIGQIANMLDKMSKIPDGTSGSLLDNTIVLLVSELGDSALHDHWRVPFVLAGGKNTGLKGNRALDFRSANGGKGANHGDLLTAIAQKAGYTSISKFGLASGPMNGIW